MKLTATHEMHLRNIHTADQAWRKAKVSADERAKAIAAEEIRSYLSAVDHEVRLAKEAGVPAVRIRVDGLGSQSPLKLRESLARTEKSSVGLAEKLSADPLAERYSREGSDLVITLDGEALKDAAYEEDWSFAAAKEAGVDTARFKIETRGDGSHYLAVRFHDVLPKNVPFLQEFGKVHPVIAWAQVPANEAEALAWHAGRAAA